MRQNEKNDDNCGACAPRGQHSRPAGERVCVKCHLFFPGGAKNEHMTGGGGAAAEAEFQRRADWSAPPPGGAAISK